jgi:hypothetical protein
MAIHLRRQFLPGLKPQSSPCSAYPFCVPRGAHLVLSLFRPLLFHCYFSDARGMRARRTAHSFLLTRAYHRARPGHRLLVGARGQSPLAACRLEGQSANAVRNGVFAAMLARGTGPALPISASTMRAGRLRQAQSSVGRRPQPSLARAAWPIAWRTGAQHRSRPHSCAREVPRRSGSASAARERVGREFQWPAKPPLGGSQHQILLRQQVELGIVEPPDAARVWSTCAALRQIEK